MRKVKDWGSGLLLEKGVTGEGVFRSIYLFPMAVSFIASGIVWRVGGARPGAGALDRPAGLGPAFVVILIWQFTSAWNDFLFTLFLTNRNTGPVTHALMELASAQNPDYARTMAGVLIASLPTLLVHIVLGKYFIRGLMSVGPEVDGGGRSTGYHAGVRRRRWVKILLGVLAATVALAVAAALGTLAWVNSSLLRVQVSLPDRGGVWLIVGIDDRAAADDQILQDTGTGEPGARADVLLLARVEGGALQLLSVDRRVVVVDASGTPARLGASWLDGPQRTVDLFCQGLGVGVGHLVQVDFGGLVEVVDALGGVEVHLDHALRDEPAHLTLEAGTQRVDGRTALALVRSRQGQLLVDGQWRAEDRGMQGRQQRTGMVLGAVMKAMRESAPGLQWAAADAGRRRIALDPGTGVQDILGLRGLTPASEVLVTKPAAEDDLTADLAPEGERQLDAFRGGKCA